MVQLILSFVIFIIIQVIVFSIIFLAAIIKTTFFLTLDSFMYVFSCLRCIKKLLTN